MGTFDKQKQTNLKKFELAKERNLADKDAIPLCDFINSLDNFYTTSSCAGRIVIMKSEGKKEPQCFIEKWHREVLFDEVKETLSKSNSDPLVWLKQEGAIFHIICRTLADAEKLVVLARNLGWKRTGIQVVKKERVIVEIISTEHMDVPLIDKGKKLVENFDDYLKFLVNLTNKKHRKARAELENLKKEIMGNWLL